MFTGIIETMARLVSFQDKDSNREFIFESNITHKLKVDQSVSHNGVCLTVERISDNQYQMTAIAETLQKTNLGNLGIGHQVNIERCMPAHGRFDGHIVQGHVDQTGICTEIQDQNGSWKLWFEAGEGSQNLLVEKGSICINGVSLTVVDVTNTKFSVCIIPYTWENTNLGSLRPDHTVNLEFDILGKYIQKNLSSRNLGL
ncbi:MAG: riboflavin synthase [Leadbetterella sp.]